MDYKTTMDTKSCHKAHNDLSGLFLRAFVPLCLILLSYISALAIDNKTQTIEAEKSKLAGDAIIQVDKTASGKQVVGLQKHGDALFFTKLPKAEKLAIRYATVNVGTLSISINQQKAFKVNVHSSGAVTGSFIHAIIDVTIPEEAELKIFLDSTDVRLNIDNIIIGDGQLGLPHDIWNLPPLPIAEGPYKADWREISRRYSVPNWWREAKFGAWAHWDPQSMPEKGDWYARGMYIEGNWQYDHHLRTYGHPSEFGYKDICNNWVIDKWNPEELMDLYSDMGAHYFVAMGVHHDNFDCWNSKFQPWNSVNVGPKVDIVGTWEKVARQHGFRFGIGFHNTPARTWGQFMTVRYNSDKNGDMKGIPYDALQTILDGKGLWWEGMDPVDLYGPAHDIKNPLQSPFANQFMWRIDDAITKYHPDMIYFDEHGGDSQIDLGVQMGLGFLAPQLIANYYNKSLRWNNGKMEAVINLKGIGGRYNSFENNPDLLPFVDRALVKSNEFHIEPEIMAYPFQTETSITDWHFKTGQEYMKAQTVIELLMQNVSRNGTMLLNLTQHGRGDLDPELVRIARDVGAWLKINGEAVYNSRPFETCGVNTVCYTRNNGNVYAAVFNWNDSIIVLKELQSGGATLGKVHKVEMLGSSNSIKFIQNEQGLTVIPDDVASNQPGITDSILAQKYRVLRITHDKDWFNDDDPGVSAPGWFRKCNLGTGDFNDDLTISNTPGNVWCSSFSGNYIAVIAPKENGAGKMEIRIDGKIHKTIDLNTMGQRMTQQMVFEEDNLLKGKHSIEIIHRGNGIIAIDGLVIK